MPGGSSYDRNANNGWRKLPDVRVCQVVVELGAGGPPRGVTDNCMPRAASARTTVSSFAPRAPWHRRCRFSRDNPEVFAMALTPRARMACPSATEIVPASSLSIAFMRKRASSLLSSKNGAGPTRGLLNGVLRSICFRGWVALRWGGAFFERIVNRSLLEARTKAVQNGPASGREQVVIESVTTRGGKHRAGT